MVAVTHGGEWAMTKTKKQRSEFNEPLEKLPDYAALKQVRDAIWHLGDVHGAAVMVGAGFSRFSKLASATTPAPPLWRDFKQAMSRDLYPTGGGPSDPLVLAEEYRSTLGAGALESIIRSHVRDTEWEPGQLHHYLLRLPWADVLTTNWDTLLERSAAADADTSYDVVRVTADISRAGSPRIVKLHGSMPSYLPFIFTEEDFRTYPEKFAPFVNLAQQALLENELCLLGFSGEDPNFLKWAGWVRDKLGDAARPIRLVGVLNLSPSRRHLFETRNITPIDLAPLVEDEPAEDRHRRATEIFLDYLWEARPPVKVKWDCTDEKEYGLASLPDAEGKLARLTDILRTDRERHPGWLVTPSIERMMGRFEFGDVFPLLATALPTVSATLRVKVLFEITWRSNALFWTVPHQLEEIADKALEAGEDRALTKEQRTVVHLMVLRGARRRRDWGSFDGRLKRLQQIGGRDADIVARYEQCLAARDQLDYAFIQNNAARIDGDDPVWGLRRGALLSEILDTKGAAKAVHQAHKEIRRRRSQDRRSLWLLSREAWAAFMLRSASFELDEPRSDESLEWPLAYRAKNADPWEEFNSLDDAIAEAEKRRRSDTQTKRYLFDPGRYLFQSRGTRMVNHSVSTPHEQLTHLAETAGVPLRLGSFEILGRRWSQAIDLLESDLSSVNWLALRSVIDHDYELLDTHFSRLAVAKMPVSDVSAMVKALKGAIAFGTSEMARRGDQVGDWASRLRRLCELLSRLSLRLQGEDAIDCFRVGASLLSDPANRHWWTLEGVANLLRRSLDALEPERRHEVALDVLRLPLPNEAKFSISERDFPETSDLLPVNVWSTRENTHGWNSRIAHLLHEAGKLGDPDSRRHAIFRLLRLFEANSLTEVEAAEFGRALWAGEADDRLLSATGLLPHVFLSLPAPDPNKPPQLMEGVVDALVNGSLDSNLLLSLHGASFTLKHNYQHFQIDPNKAVAIFDSTMQWRPRPHESDDVPFGHHVEFEDQRLEVAIARALSTTVVLSMPLEQLTDERCQRLFERLGDGTMPSLVMALPALVERRTDHADRSYRAIRDGLSSQQEQIVTSALNAMRFLVQIWGHEPSLVEPFLVSEVVSLCLMRREPGLASALRMAAQMVKARLVPAEERQRLMDGIEAIRQETRYDLRYDEQNRSDVGLIRRAAIQLCEALKEAGEIRPVLVQWISEAVQDPLPEVRHALLEPYE
jgi:hypothetical protein